MPKNANLSKKHVAHLEQVRRQTQAIKTGAIILIVLVVGLVSYGILMDTTIKPYRPVASVNGEWITVHEFQAAGKFQRLQLIQQYMQYVQYAQMFGVSDPMNDQNFGPAMQQISTQLNDSAQFGRQMLDLEISNKLIRQEAKKKNIVVSAADVDKAMQEGFGYFPNGTLTPEPTIPTPVEPTLNPTELALVTLTPTPGPVLTETPTITATLDPSITPTVTEIPTSTPTTGPTETPGPTFTPQPTATPITLEGYQELLKTQVATLNTQAGLTESDFRTYYENNLYHQKLQELVVADLKPTQEQVWARHILVDTEDEAKKVIERLNKGEDFGKIAAELSKDTGSGAKGGDLGWFGSGIMVKEFQDAAFALKVGEISQPIKSQFGYHIIQALGHEERPLNEADFKKYKDQTFTDYLAKLKEAAKIEEYDLWKEVVPTEPALPQQQ